MDLAFTQTLFWNNVIVIKLRQEQRPQTSKIYWNTIEDISIPAISQFKVELNHNFFYSNRFACLNRFSAQNAYHI